MQGTLLAGRDGKETPGAHGRLFLHELLARCNRFTHKTCHRRVFRKQKREETSFFRKVQKDTVFELFLKMTAFLPLIFDQQK